MLARHDDVSVTGQKPETSSHLSTRTSHDPLIQLLAQQRALQGDIGDLKVKRVSDCNGRGKQAAGAFLAHELYKQLV